MSREGRKEGGVVVVFAVVLIVGIDDGHAAFLSGGGGDKGIVVEGVVRATKKEGSLSSSPLSESPPAPIGVGGARGRGDVGVPQVRPAE